MRQPERGFLDSRIDRNQRVIGDRTDRRQHHDRKDQRRGQHSNVGKLTVQQWEVSAEQVRKPVSRRTEQGNQHKVAPEPVDHTGDGSQQLDDVLEDQLERL